jgi:hypothetical protein
MAIPFEIFEWAQMYQKNLPSRSTHCEAHARSSAQEKLSKASGDPWSCQFTMSCVEYTRHSCIQKKSALS